MHNIHQPEFELLMVINSISHELLSSLCQGVRLRGSAMFHQKPMHLYAYTYLCSYVCIPLCMYLHVYIFMMFLISIGMKYFRLPSCARQRLVQFIDLIYFAQNLLRF